MTELKIKKKHEHWTQYWQARNEIKQLLVEAHDSYVKNLLDTTVNEKPKRFWSYIRNLQQDQVGISQLQYNNSIKTDSVGKTEALNHQFQSIFTNDLVNMPSKGESPYISMPDINFSCKEIKNLLHNL